MKHVLLKYDEQDSTDALQLQRELTARGVEVSDCERTARRTSKRITNRNEARDDYLVILVSPEVVASEGTIAELHKTVLERCEGCVLAAMIRPTFVLPWYFRKLPIFNLWDDRAAGIEQLVQAIKGTKRQRAAG